VIIREVTHEVIREVPVEKVCTSRRVVRFKVRRFYPGVANHQGSRITRVVKAETESIGTLPDGSDRTTVLRSHGRWVVRVDFRGVTFTGFDNSTRTTVVVRTRRGERRLIYRSDQCRARQGNPNDDTARALEIPVKR
jgi:hypothetical protein